MKIVSLVAAASLVAGCSSKDQQRQTHSAAVGNLRVTMAFAPDPPRKGSDILTVTLKDGTGAPVKGAIVKVDTTMPSMSMPGPSMTARNNGDGTYSARLALQYATRWQFAVSATASGKTATAHVTADVK